VIDRNFKITPVVTIVYMRDGRVIWQEPERLRLTYQPKKEESETREALVRFWIAVSAWQPWHSKPFPKLRDFLPDNDRLERS
jgi:hypothetical protein